MTMKLYYAPGACSLAPHIALFELGLSVQAVKVNLRDKTSEDGKDFWAINPKGSVPFLSLGNGESVSEVAVILQYLADLKPEKNLIAKWGTPERYQGMQWLNYIATEMHKGYSPLWNKQMPDEAKKIALENLQRRFQFLENHFASHAFLMGDNYSVADAYLFTVLNWSRHLKLDLTEYPHLVNYVEKVKARPATVEAMKAEGIWRE